MNGITEMIIVYSLLIISAIIVTYAQTKINLSYGKYKKINSKGNLTGKDVARKILDSNNLADVKVKEVSGELTDHYDPRIKTVNLSSNIFNGTSIASISVAAHECGHAIQDKVGYTFMRIRAMLVPVVRLVSYLGYFSIVISLFAGITGYLKVGIIIEFATLLFHLVTLPVEFNASSRAKKELVRLHLIEDNEYNGVDSMLSAAANTYVASLLSNLLNLFRLLLILKNRDD
ncbi:MAG: zinc metallopeptidase [Firmicutes bacterium]|nr:zinc metallopeptidase [Bacillota bacterium]